MQCKFICNNFQEHIFKQEMLTTKKPMSICQDAIRAEFLNRIPPYIAYALKVFQLYFTFTTGRIVRFIQSVFFIRRMYSSSLSVKPNKHNY